MVKGLGVESRGVDAMPAAAVFLGQFDEFGEIDAACSGEDHIAWAVAASEVLGHLVALEVLYGL